MNLEPEAHAALRSLAERLLRGERRDHTLSATDLTHEAWLRLAGTVAPGGAVSIAAAPDRLLLAARVMRQVLVDHARRRATAKRRPAEGSRALDPEQVAVERDAYVVALDEALRELATLDPELAAVVDLRFFGGLGIDEVGSALALSPRTVKRRFALAKAWLHREIAAP